MEINKLIGGLNTDVHPSSQPAHTVRDMKNMVPMSTDGNLFSLENSDGNLLTDVVYPDGFKPIGHTVLNTDVIVILAHEDGYSQVGVIQDKNGWSYTAIAPADVNGDVPNDNSELGFTQEKPVQCVARKLIDGHRVVYYTDNNIPFGRIDLDNPPEVGSATAGSALIPNMKMPRFSYKVTTDVVASWRPGKIFVLSRYVTDSGGVTFFSLPSDGIDVFEGNNPSLVQGGYNQEYFNNAGDTLLDKDVSKAYELKISNLDDQYKDIELFVAYFEGDNFNPQLKINRVATLPITGDSISYTLTGIDSEESLNVTLEEISQQPVSYDRAKTIAQKDNTLFLGCLSSSQEVSDLQDVANAIEVSYEIEELPYSNREGGSESSGVIGVQQSDIEELILSYPKKDKGTAFNSAPEDPSRYTLSYNKTPTLGSVLINTTVVGDTFTFDNGIDQAIFTFVDPLVVTSPGEFEIEIGATDEDTAQNFVQKINDNTALEELQGLVQESDTDKLLFYTSNFTDVTVVSSGTYTTSDLTNAFSSLVLNPTSVSADDNGATLVFDQLIYAGGLLSFDADVTNVAGQTSVDNDESYGLTVLPLESGNNFSISSGSSGSTDYADEVVISEKKTYRRREAYSLSFCLLMKNGGTSPAFHIPGRIQNVSPSNLINGTTGRYSSPDWGGGSGYLGTFDSSLDYPTDSNFPGNVSGDDQTIPRTDRSILHHVMPSLEQEPHVRVDSNGLVYIRSIKLKFDFTKDIPASVLENVQEVLFLRESRSNGNKSVIAQGIANQMTNIGINFNKDDNKLVTSSTSSSINGSNVNDVIRVVPKPLFGTIDTMASFLDGYTYFNGSNSSNYPGSPNPSHQPKHLFFTSPDSVFQNVDADDLQGLTLENELEMGGSNYVLASGIQSSGLTSSSDKWPQGISDGYVFGITGGNYTNKYAYAARYPSPKGFANFTEYRSPSSKTVTQINNSRLLKEGQAGEDPLQIADDFFRPWGRWMSRGIELTTQDDVDYPSSNASSTFYVKVDSGSLQYGTGDFRLVNLNTTGTEVCMNLYNIYSNATSQYGSIGGEYLLAGRSEIQPTGVYSNIFGGDTVISKFHTMSESIVNFMPPFSQDKSGPVAPEQYWSYDPSGYPNVKQANKDGRVEMVHNDGLGLGQPYAGIRGIPFVESTYFFVESEVNTYLRHTSADQDDRRTYIPFGDYNTSYRFFEGFKGNLNLYNPQYSFGPVLRKFYTSFNSSIVSKFENRIIYSQKAANDDTLDSYRVFQQNDYYDLPANTGAIWNLFVAFNTLYAHTPKSLWKTFAEPAATLDSQSIGSVILGTGELFQRPSQEMITTEGGYGGSISQFGGVHCPIGYIFPDILQSRILAVVNGGELRELSKNSISVFLSKNMIDVVGNDLSIITPDTAYLIDNPYMNIGFTGGYDYRLKTAYVSKNGDNGFTLGYFTDAMIFSGFYDIEPNAFVQFDDRLLELKDSSVYESNKGEKNTFYGVLKESIAEFVSGAENQNGKTFDNIYIDSERYVEGVLQRDSFNKVKVKTNYAESNEEDIVVAIDALDEVSDDVTRMTLSNDEFRMAFPRTTDETRIKGDNAIIRLVYNKEGKFIVKQVLVKYRSNAR